MKMNGPVTMAAAMLVCLALTVTAVNGETLSDVDITLLERLDIMADEIRETRQETETARHAMERATQETRLARRETEKARLETVRASLETDEVRSTLELVEADSDAIRQDMADMKSDLKHEDDAVKVAFSVASHDKFGPVTVDTNVPYELSYTNIGNGWKSGINSFQAPVNGFYEFSATMRSQYTTDNPAICHIVHTDSVGQTTMASMYGGIGENPGDESGMSNSVIIELEQGDYVSVQLDGGDAGRLWNKYDEVYSTFSGFLLFRGA